MVNIFYYVLMCVINFKFKGWIDWRIFLNFICIGYWCEKVRSCVGIRICVVYRYTERGEGVEGDGGGSVGFYEI